MTRLTNRHVRSRPMLLLPARRLAPAALAALGLALAAVPPLGAGLPDSPVKPVLVESRSPEELRDRLRQRADSLRGDREAAGEAWSFAGQSYEHSAAADSAIACYRRAGDLRGRHEDVLRLADALLRRRAAGDVAEARGALAAGRFRASAEETGMVPLYDARLAWGDFLAGHADSAALAFAPLETRLEAMPEWRYRVGLATLEAGNPRKAFTLFEPLAIASRAEDREVMKHIGTISDQTRQATRIQEAIDRGIKRRDRADGIVIEGLGGKGVRFAAHDRFPLGGVLVPAAGSRSARPRTAVVLVAPGDSIVLYDSLATALRGAGLATVLLDVRGSGWSVGEACALPDTWRGREERLQRLVARDVTTAARSLAESMPVDTTRIVLVAVGSTAPIAAEAANLDPRIQALVLVSPAVAPVELGPMRARLARAGLPAFFQLGADDFPYWEENEVLLHAGDERASRFVDVKTMPGGAAAFRRDPKAGARLAEWIRTALAKPRKAGAAPRSRPR